MDWLSSCEQQFDLIFVDPPTFSNSKRMEGIFDVHKDHVRLLTMALRCLAPNGCIVFSCNAQRFELDREGLAPARCEDITARTVPPDFTRRVPHRCWLIQHQR